jgi:outer membrane protein assembly factor BamD (BamD/ComL family)/TM2 domain-containing membrane protein YozV
MRLHFKLLLFFSLSVFLPLAQPPSVQPDDKGILLTEKIQLKMADVFMEEGEYYRAITEYRKFLILFPDSEKTDYALFRIGLAYYRGEEYGPSRQYFSALGEKYKTSPYLPEAAFYEGLSHWKLKDREKAGAAFDTLSEAFPGSEFAPLALVAGSVIAFEEENVPESIKRLERLTDRYPEYPGSQNAREAIPLIGRYPRLPEKSEALAAVMSAVLPGSGYIYAERVGDGITAFLINALFIAGTIAAVNAENYGVAGLVGGIGLPFYLGNIYGSANAAKKWNLAVKRDLRNKVFLTLDFRF